MKPTRIGLATLIGLGIGVFGAFCQFVGVFDTWSVALTDRFFLSHPADPKTIIVAIDDASLGRIGRWPWPRTVHADLVDRLSSYGVKAIGYDVNFPEPSDAGADTKLAAAVRRSGKVVMPIELDFTIENGRLAFQAGKITQPIAEIQSAAAASGFTNTPLDEDGISRRVPVSVRDSGGSVVNSLSYEVARLAGRAPDLSQVPTDKYGRFIINFPGAPGRNFRTVAASDVLQDRVDSSIFKDATVFIGATARNLQDYKNVATSRGEPMAGVEIHASIHDTLISGRWIRNVNAGLQAGLLLLVGVLLGLLVPRLRPRYSILGTLILWVGWLVAAFALFDRGYVLDIVWPTLVIFFAYAALLLERWLDVESQRRQLRSAFSRYVSGSVVESIMQNPEKLKLGGERRRMSVLFSDLRGFTTLSEGLSPEKLVEVLNTYLDEMTNIVFDEGGVLDKYIGDAVMAFWNAPFDQPDHAARSVRCAVRMRDRLKAMNAEGVFPKGIELKVGVGVNTGEMVVGNIGAETRYDYTVIGDSVNLASRTESLCKEYGVGIIVTQNTAVDLADAFHMRLLDQVAVKGKKEPIRLFEVLGLKGKVAEDELAFARRYEEALNQYFTRHFDEALQACDKLLTERPEAVSVIHLKERCEIYRQSPPPEGWDGTWVMTKK
ncbi:adenylate/guanylate cyclase domain-containing protein [Patescibacteria group bacterium]|jgi:adenylate cyclase|nr:adenylate/guanylate cyclase domain-containing protein [Patescibacteria group bacterium]